MWDRSHSASYFTKQFMFSPGTYHKHVPRNYEENLDFRSWLLKKCRESVHAQKACLYACSQDILFYINSFVFQHNPNAAGDEVGPWISWDFQDEAFYKFLWCIENRRDLVIEKSREMGASWMSLLVMDWMSMFKLNKKFLLVSRNADAVDKPEDSDCLMWKLDFVHEHLPDWMIKGQISRRKMGMTYLRTRSIITGQASTGKAGVGGRATAAFIDEFSQIEEDQQVLHRTADTTRCRIFNFTHVGLDTAAYEISQRSDIQKLVLHWSQHPEKKKGLYQVDSKGKVEVVDKIFAFAPDHQFVTDGSPTGGPFPGIRSPWYDEECIRRKDQRQIAMDLDINPKGATNQFYDALKIHDLKGKCQSPWWEGELQFDFDLGKPIQLIKAESIETYAPIKLWLNLTPEGVPPPSKYCAGADIAAGSGATPSCLSILDALSGNKILEFRDAFIEPDRFAALAVALCRVFVDEDGDPCFLTWEMQGPGVKFCDKVLQLGYRNMYFRTNESTISKEVSDVPGWFPSPSNKRLLHEDYRGALYRRLVYNPSVDALDECLSFVHTKGSVEHSQFNVENDPSGATVNHGDMVIADALAYKGAKGVKQIQLKKTEEIKVGSLAWRRELRKNRQREAEWV